MIKVRVASRAAKRLNTSDLSKLEKFMKTLNYLKLKDSWLPKMKNLTAAQ